MQHVLLIQLPIPQLNLGMRTGNIPLAAACLKQAARNIHDTRIDILPEISASYLGDAALTKLIIDQKPDIVGFTVYNWNIEQSLYAAKKIKAACHSKIIFGGPEITQDNPLVYSDAVDFLVFGEGEAVFAELMENKQLWLEKHGSRCADILFRQSRSPYLNHLIEPDINNLMYLETQRGCPYGCGFCFYNKSLGRMTFVNEDIILKAIRWAVAEGIEELCLLDPSLNLRPNLKSFLQKIKTINNHKTLNITGEIRADAIDEEMADLFAQAGFSGFEIGLQTTNKNALAIMNRPTNLKKFVNGAMLLKQRDILPRIDLIVGLPGDTLDGFKASVNFLVEHDIHIDVQVFSLSVLPGTNFRKKYRDLGLEFTPSPPYTVIKTPTFSEYDMLEAYDYAESVFDVSLFPDPHLDIAFKTKNTFCHDSHIMLKNRNYVSKIYLNSIRPIDELAVIAEILTHPYQIFITKKINDISYIQKVLDLLTSKNPFTPLELVFLEPSVMPDTKAFLNAVKIKRPHYLDIDLRFIYGTEGNRTILFTLVTQDHKHGFFGQMKRQVFWWRQRRLPERKEIEEFSQLDGILIDVSGESDNSEGRIHGFQDRFYKHADDLPDICFADISHQKRWLQLIASDEFSPLMIHT